MNQTVFPSRRGVLAGVGAGGLVLGLGGCVSLPGVTSDTQLFRLSPKSTFSNATPRFDGQLVIDEPLANQAIDTDQIAVQTAAFRLQYISGARWADRAPRMVQALLLESFENSGKIVAVGRQAIGLRSDFTMLSEVREFQVEQTPSGTEVLVRLNVKLVRQDASKIVASESFESRRAAPALTADGLGDVIIAFDDALGRVLKLCVEWTLTAMVRTAPG